MLKTTSAKLRGDDFADSPLGLMPMTACAVRAQADNSAAGSLLQTVPRGQVFLITDVIVQADVTATVVGGHAASPTSTNYGLSIENQAGTDETAISFKTNNRWQSTFDAADTPNWKNAAPGNIVHWRPKYAIAIPSGWNVKSGPTLGASGVGNHAAVYGYMVDEDSARSLGYQVSPSATDDDRRYIVAASAGAASYTDLIPGRTGKSIRILDIHIRMQSETNATNTLSLQQEDGREIFHWTSNNPADLLNMEFSPDIFLRSGQGLQIQTTDVGTVSVNVSCEYVDEDEVPGNHWWACVQPVLPTPGLFSATEGAANPIRSSATVVQYYPRRNVTLSGGDPLARDQHVIRGYTMSVQKDTGTAPDQTFFTISSGSTPSGVDVPTGTGQTNYQLAPTFVAPSHDISINMAIDGLRIPCQPGDGILHVNTVTLGTQANALATPSSAVGNIDDWAFCMWGETVADQYTGGINRGV